MKIIFTILLLVGIGFGQTSQYEEVFKTDTVTYTVDKTSIATDDKGITTFIGFAYTSNIKIYSGFILNCQTRTYIMPIEKGETAEELFTREYKNPKILTPGKGTPIEAAINYVCRGKGIFKST